MSEITKMSDIHTIVFKTSHADLPIERKLFPVSARTLNIFCNPEKYGWAPAIRSDAGIVNIEMRGLGIDSSTILEFVRTLRNGFLDPRHISTEKMEHFAILMGAGDEGCPFRKILENYRVQQQQKKEKKANRDNKERIALEMLRLCPRIPAEDIDDLFYWELDNVAYARDHLSSDEWVPMGPCPAPSGIGTGLYYYRKRKPTVSSDI